MKVVHTKRLIGQGSLASSREWDRIRNSVISSIERVEWPKGSGKFVLNPVNRGNGVTEIKSQVATYLNESEWDTEIQWPINDLRSPGKIDGAYESSHGLIAFEWETGNVASSHRSMNKMCLGLVLGVIAGGILAVSTRRMARLLTDRIGNFEELEPYFALWQATKAQTGVLELIAVEHNGENERVPLIPKAVSGRRNLG